MFDIKMKALKSILYSLIVFCAMGKICFAKPPTHEARIAAVVNEDSILTTELEDRLKLVIISSQLENNAATQQQLKGQILKLLIDELLQLQLTEKFDIKTSDAEVEQEFALLEERNGMRKGELEKFLSHNAIPKSVLLKQLKSNMSWRYYIRQRYHPLIQISKAEIQNIANRLENEKGQKQVLLAEIVISFATPEEEAKAKVQANRLVQQLQKGAQFPMLAQQFSHSASATRGGDIGWISLNQQLETSLQEAIAKLAPGELSSPIRTSTGYHIVLIRDQRQAGDNSEQLISFLKVFIPWAPNSTMEEKEKLYIRAQQISANAKSVAILERLAQALPNVEAKMMSDTRLNALHPQLREELSKLPIGKPGQPLATPMGIFIFAVENTREAKPDTEDEIYSRIAEQKLMLVAQRELRNLRRDAFIDIRI